MQVFDSGMESGGPELLAALGADEATPGQALAVDFTCGECGECGECGGVHAVTLNEAVYIRCTHAAFRFAMDGKRLVVEFRPRAAEG